MGAKMTPTAKKSGSTVLGVKMGCQAFSRCWRKALSVLLHQPKHIPRSPVYSASSLGGLLLFGWSFLSTSSLCVLCASCCTSIVCEFDILVSAIVAAKVRTLVEVEGRECTLTERTPPTSGQGLGWHDGRSSTNSSLHIRITFASPLRYYTSHNLP